MRILYILLALLIGSSAQNSFSAAELEQKEAAADIDPTIRSLLIFLDDSEAYYYDASNPSYDHHFRATTRDSRDAIESAAGPILISGSLLYNLLRKPKEYDNNITPLHTFYANFNPNNWIIREIKAPQNQATTLYCMIPRGYLGISHTALQQLGTNDPITELEYTLGLQIEHMSTISANNKQELRSHFMTQYDGYTVANYHSLEDRTGNDFIKSCIQEKTLFVSQSDYIKINREPTKWIIYLGGHGMYGSIIAQLSFKEFDTFLRFLEKTIITIFFVYSSCYAAGFNAKQVFGELMAKGGARTLPFPIVTQALTDAETFPSKVYFKAFIEYLLKNPSNYEKAILSLIPLQSEIFTIPQIRFPHVPAWFPVTEYHDEIVRITKIKAAAQKNSLEIMHHHKAILLYTNHVPFLIDFSSQKPLISMIPGSALHVIDATKFDRKSSLDSFFIYMSAIQYGSSKIFFIKNIALSADNTNLTNVVIHYNPNTKPLFFFTENTQYKTYLNGKFTNSPTGDYMKTYKPLLAYSPEQVTITIKKIEQALPSLQKVATPIKLRLLIELELYPLLDFADRRNLRYILEQIAKQSPEALEIFKNIISRLINNYAQQAAKLTRKAYGGSSYWGNDFSIQEFGQQKWQKILTDLIHDKDIATLLDHYTPELSPPKKPVNEKNEKTYEPEVPAGLML
ncbi:MAG TPA: hypothetical protein VGT41_00900 [Candidatus Babeliales bacterium]|nr:hypothetical protein [Candidatus Babeliales bacterium]